MRCWLPGFLAPALGPLLLSSVLGLAALMLGTGCEDSSQFYGLSLRVSANYNGWNKDEQAPTLLWNEASRTYSGVVEMPGDEVALRLFASRIGLLIGFSGTDGETPIPTSLTTEASMAVRPLRFSTPLSARYQLDFDPQNNWLHVDLAADAEKDQTPDAGLLIAALRGSDHNSIEEQISRGNELIATMRARSIETPIKSQVGPYQSITLLHLGPISGKALSLVGDLNNWTAGLDPLHFVPGGNLAYIARRGNRGRLSYQFDRDGVRYADPLNLEIRWEGADLPPNPDNLLGGNLGEWNSVAYTPGYVEQGSRLRRLPVPAGPLGTGEVIIYLPPGYEESQAQRFPTLYVHDGKDAIVRGQYDYCLDVLEKNGQIAPVIGVFISAPSKPISRLAALTHFSDVRYPEIAHQGDLFAQYLYDTVIPAVEQTYRTMLPRAMLGVDMAGTFAVYLAWTDPQKRFTRVVSQSGRFDWGGSMSAGNPYFDAISRDKERFLAPGWRLAIDFSGAEHLQAAANENLHTLLDAGNTHKDSLNFFKQNDEFTDPWANLRARSKSSLAFLLHDSTAE